LFTFCPPGPRERLNEKITADFAAQQPRPRSIASPGRTGGFGFRGGSGGRA
jgi:hypothetical protein